MPGEWNCSTGSDEALSEVEVRSIAIDKVTPQGINDHEYDLVKRCSASICRRMRRPFC